MLEILFSWLSIPRTIGIWIDSIAFSLVDNIYDLIEEILGTYIIDGIECYHSEFNNDNIEYLKKLCHERKFLMSGGSDYHGINKPKIEMAVGRGNLQIPLEIINEWKDL